MAELDVVNHPEQHDYSGSRDMPVGRRLRIRLTDGGQDDEEVLDQRVPNGEAWTVKLSVVKIINND